MPSNVRLIFDCPFCTPHRGVVAVDEGSMILRAGGSNQLPAPDWRQPFSPVLFNPGVIGGVAAAGPCPHTIAFRLDGTATPIVSAFRGNGAADDRRPFLFITEWHHPGFKIYDPGLQQFLWDNLDVGGQSGLHRVRRHCLDRLAVDLQRPAWRWRIETAGVIVVAPHPATFFDNLEMRWQRIQEYEFEFAGL